MAFVARYTGHYLLDAGVEEMIREEALSLGVDPDLGVRAYLSFWEHSRELLVDLDTWLVDATDEEVIEKREEMVLRVPGLGRLGFSFFKVMVHRGRLEYFTLNREVKL
jgi:hypothetical protein